ncbi:MAG TPA: hypothetical protein VHD31_02380 [Candidatus Paceibacterota bacterium]|nr:hypothetical protein [Candidatus Paceibacterota bacterium]
MKRLPPEGKLPEDVEMFRSEVEAGVRTQNALKGWKTRLRHEAGLLEAPDYGSVVRRPVVINIEAIPRPVDLSGAELDRVYSGPISDEGIANYISRWRARFRPLAEHWDLAELTRTGLENFLWIKPEDFENIHARVLAILRARQRAKAALTRQATAQRLADEKLARRQLNLFHR